MKRNQIIKLIKFLIQFHYIFNTIFSHQNKNFFFFTKLLCDKITYQNDVDPHHDHELVM